MALLLIAELTGVLWLGPLNVLLWLAAFMWLNSFQQWRLERRKADDDSLSVETGSTETGLFVKVPAFNGQVPAEVERKLLKRVPAALRDTTKLALAEIQPFCSERFPEHYTGFTVFERPGRKPGVTVLRSPSDAFDAEVRQRFAHLGDALTFADPDAPDPDEPEVGEQQLAELQELMERAFAEIQPFCSERFPDYYAGFAVSPRPGKQPGVTLFRRPSMLFDLQVRERFADLGDALTFADARWSAKQLEELAQRVIADRQYWADRGVHIDKVIPSPSGEELSIVAPDASSARGQLTALYGRPLGVYDKAEDVPPPAQLEDPVEPDPPLTSPGT